MSEYIGNAIEQIDIAFKTQLKLELAKKLNQGKTLSSALDDIIKKLGIETIFEPVGIHKDRRQKINTESGLIVSNHPGSFDTAIILSTLTRPREEIKIFSSPKMADVNRAIFGDDFLIVVEKGFSRSLKTAYEIALDHISRKGVVLLFPEGAHDFRNPEINFQSSIYRLISNLDKNKMIYSFHFNHNDMSKIRSSPLVMSRLGLNFARHKAGVKSFPSPVLKIHVAEHYSQVDTWQQLLEESGRNSTKRLTKLLESHYKKLFSEIPTSSIG